MIKMFVGSSSKGEDKEEWDDYDEDDYDNR